MKKSKRVYKIKNINFNMDRKEDKELYEFTDSADFSLYMRTLLKIGKKLFSENGKLSFEKMQAELINGYCLNVPTKNKVSYQNQQLKRISRNQKKR